jgi:hypothetical protein
LRLVASSHRNLTFQLAALSARRDDLIVACRQGGMKLRQIARLAGMHYTSVEKVVQRHPINEVLDVSLVPPPPDVWVGDLESVLVYTQGLPAPTGTVGNDELQALYDRADQFWRDPNADHAAPKRAEWGRTYLYGTLQRAITDRDRLTPEEVIEAVRAVSGAGAWRIQNLGKDHFAVERSAWRDVLERLALELIDRDRRRVVADRETMVSAALINIAHVKNSPHPPGWDLITARIREVLNRLWNGEVVYREEVDEMMKGSNEVGAWRVEHFGKDPYAGWRDWFNQELLQVRDSLPTMGGHGDTQSAS